MFYQSWSAFDLKAYVCFNTGQINNNRVNCGAVEESVLQDKKVVLLANNKEIEMFAPVAQLDRASVYGTEG